MKKLLITLIMSVLVLSISVSCKESKNIGNNTNTEGMKVVDEQKDIDKLVTIKEEVNKEALTVNSYMAKYIYELPIINIDKPGAQKINEMFLNLEKVEEKRIGNGHTQSLSIKSKASLNDGIISLVMDIKKTGPGGIHVVNYDIENDKEISTKELIEKFKFDPKNLIAKINRQDKINKSKSEEEQHFELINFFVYTIIENIYDFDSEDYSKKMEEAKNKTKEEKERYVIENIDKIKAYVNTDGKFVFIHRGPLPDEELVVD